ncbi:MAG: RNA recognition motif domain-containing protein [bacterium]
MKSSKLYVGNMSYGTSEERLREAFSPYGNIVSVTVVEGKGFGFVEMDSIESAQKAKDALDGTELDGRTIRVDEARPKRQGEDFRGRRQRW